MLQKTVIGGILMKSPKIIDIRNGKRHLLAKYNREAREFEIIHKGDVTIIRVLPSGEIEVINPHPAA